jgi:hypothetical protein
MEEKNMKGKEAVMRLNATELAIVQRCLQEAIASTAPTNTDIIMSAYLLRELTKKIAPQVAVGEGGKLRLNLAQCCAWLNLVAPKISNTSMGELNSLVYLMVIEYIQLPPQTT